jgi:DNA (cytosine-5)-methyltransferase 3A
MTAPSVTPAFARGDLVWARVHGHPRWPGQVSDPARASKAASAARPAGKSLLVAFFGDRSFGWFNEGELQAFAPHYDALRKGGKTQACVCEPLQARTREC